MPSQIKDLLSGSRKRAVATIMGHVEREVYQHLPEPKRRELRAKVLGAVDAYHDLVLDVVRVLETDAESDGTVVNTEALELLRKIHEHLLSREEVQRVG